MEHQQIEEQILRHKIRQLQTFRQQIEGGRFENVDGRLHLRLRQEASRLYEAARDLDLGKPEGAVD